ncbi:SPK domain-containing protein [Caenorhabditis elegans]|nr:SPK domain-containing protein [Caenorhabditis elegans]CAR64658.1 SPK domain-containing protein [Caenorhabditis elegans]|eukprot:NP_001129883.1 Uncharacterized protein CELE_C25F9.10 [Caenorhabditis elegans]
MSEQDPPDIVIFSNLIWGAAVVCLRKFFLDRLKLEISGQNAQEILMEIVVDSFTDDTGGHLHRAWTFANHCRKSAYTLGYINQLLRNEILQSVANMEAYMNAADSEKIKEKISTSGLQITYSKNIVKIGNYQFSFNKVAH